MLPVSDGISRRFTFVVLTAQGPLGRLDKATQRDSSPPVSSFFFSFLRPFFYWGQRFFYWRLIGRNFFVDAVLVLFVCLFFHELERVSRFTGSVRVPFPGRDIHLFRFYDVIMVSCRFYWIFKKVSDG